MEERGRGASRGDVVVDERFTVGPQPDVAKLRELASQGFRSVVNLRTDGEDEQPLSPGAEGDHVRALGMQYLHVPVDVKALRDEQVDTFRREVEGLPGPIYAHCRTGIRAGAFVLMTKAVDEGMSGDEVRRAAEQKGFPCDQPQIEDFVTQYVDQRLLEDV